MEGTPTKAKSILTQKRKIIQNQAPEAGCQSGSNGWTEGSCRSRFRAQTSPCLAGRGCATTSSKVALPSTIRAPSNADQFSPENAVYRPLSQGPELQVSESDLCFGPLRPCGAALAHSDYGPVPDGIERMVCGPDEKHKIAQAVRRSAKDHEGNRTRTQIVLMGDVLIDSD